jgi:hypothetical protein
MAGAAEGGKRLRSATRTPSAAVDKQRDDESNPSGVLQKRPKFLIQLLVIAFNPAVFGEIDQAVK